MEMLLQQAFRINWRGGGVRGGGDSQVRVCRCVRYMLGTGGGLLNMIINGVPSQ